MKELIYYPTFEPRNINWLKYALLYFDEFCPIIPPNGKQYFSKTYRKLLAETDLINIIHPPQHLSNIATIKAMEKIEEIKEKPDLYRPIFGVDNIFAEWGNNNNWSQQLFGEKYDAQFEKWCISEKLGKSIPNGVLISDSLANFYMTFLVEEIALERQASPITDVPELDSLSTYLRVKDKNIDETISASQVIINQNLPVEIGNIELDKIIAFRNNSGIRELRGSYNKTVEEFSNAVERNFDPFTYYEKLEDSKANLSAEMFSFFGNLASFVLNLMLLTDHSNMEIAAKTIQGSVTVLSFKGVRKEWKLGEDRRSARKYLTKIGSIDKYY